MFFIRMEAHNDDRIHRFWEAEIERDLLGDLVVRIRHGRCGARQGRELTKIAADDQAAVRLVRQGLQRRSTAPGRIGATYLEVARRGDLSH